MDLIEGSLRETLFPALWGGGDEVDVNYQKILGHRFKCSGVDIQNHRMSEEHANSTSKESCG